MGMAGGMAGGAGGGAAGGAAGGIGGGSILQGIMGGMKGYNSVPDTRTVDLGQGYRATVITGPAEKINGLRDGALGGVMGGMIGQDNENRREAMMIEGENRRDKSASAALMERMNATDAGRREDTRNRMMMFGAQNGVDLSGLGAEDGPPASNEMLMQRIARDARSRDDAAAAAEAALAGQDAQAEQREMILNLIGGDKWNEQNARALGLPWQGGGAPVAREPGAAQQAIAQAGGQQERANALLDGIRTLEAKGQDASAVPQWLRDMFRPSAQSQSVLPMYR